MESLQLPGAETIPASDQPGQRRVGHCSPAQHHACQTVSRFQPVHILRGENVPIVPHRAAAFGQGRQKGRQIHRAFIHSRPGPGMDDQPLDGVFIVYFKDLGKFLRPLYAHPGLDGNGHGAAAENLRQTVVQRPEICQHPGPLVLGHHCAGGAADVQVHFLIAQLLQLPSHPEKGLRPVYQQLRDQPQPRIVFRQNIPQGAGLELAAAVRSDEGREVFLHAAEKPGVGLPV